MDERTYTSEAHTLTHPWYHGNIVRGGGGFGNAGTYFYLSMGMTTSSGAILYVARSGGTR